MTELTCIITGHHEGRLAVASLRSFHAAIEAARAEGRSCQPIYILDNPDPLTEEVFRSQAEGNQGEVLVVEFGDQGKARNVGVERAKGKYSAFLDADDLWSRQWLIAALDFLADKPSTYIAHPEFNYFFEGQATVFCHIDQQSPDFRPDLLRVGNYWDALCVCPTEIYREFPFYQRDIAGGWAYEDWFWNCETYAAGKIHKVVPETVLFKRRQKVSQTVRAAQNKSMIKANALSRYSHPGFHKTKRTSEPDTQ